MYCIDKFGNVTIVAPINSATISRKIAKRAGHNISKAVTANKAY